MLKKVFATTFSLALLTACAPNLETQSLRKQVKIQESEVMVMNLTAEQKAKAENLGIKVEGDVILTLKGSQANLEKLNLTNYISDDQVIIEGPGDGELNPEHFYLAREDFALPEFLKKHPTYDGRGVIVGGIDDGVAPNLPGMQKTTDGKRKFINRTSNSELYQEITKSVGEEGSFNADVAAYTKSYKEKFDNAYEAILKLEDFSGVSEDLNGQGTKEFHAAVFVTGDEVKACFDVNADEKLQKNECLRPFSTSGDYIYWNKSELRELTFEFDLEEKTIKYSEGEVSGDSHGEGVASVMAGHNIAGRFDGVAPGAQYIDFDLSQNKKEFNNESVYSIGTFLRALEWMGKNKAEVVNISYSLFFVNAQSQEFMREALEKLVEKYNFVVSFSAGNNGPGLGSHNRGAIYPADSLVAGAYLNKELDEIVHGVTGLPEQGQVVYYSSIGPGVHNGAGPTVISPLSSLTHSSGTDGFRAFSGTSSAAPALAGAAAVLISAVKQEGLKVDAGAIVHSLRLSGEMLKGVSFVEQGRGLPKLPKALNIYKKMIAGKIFKDVKVTISGKDDNKIERKGLFYNLSDKKGITEEIISLKGLRAKLSPIEEAMNLLETVDVVYSHDFIGGANDLWVSSARSHLFINIDFDKVKKLAKPEIFADIRLISKKTKEVLQIIPLTFINDVIMKERIVVKTKLVAQSGHRKHLKIPVGTQAIAFKFHEGSELLGFVRATYYDTSRKKVQTTRDLKPGMTYFFRTEDFGLTQFTLSRFGGSKKVLDISYEITPVMITVPNKAFSTYEDLKVINHSKDFGVSFKLQKISNPIAQKSSSITFNSPLEISADIESEGSYELSTKLNVEGPMTYPYESCMTIKKTAKGKESKSWGRYISFYKDEAPGKVTFRCFFFDLTDSSIYSGINVFSKITKENNASDVAHTYLKSGENMLDLDKLEKKGNFKIERGERYKLIISPLLDTLNDGTDNEVIIADDLMAY